MSQLLQGLAVNGALVVSPGTTPPDHMKNGIPFDADGSIAVDVSGAISHHHQGLPFTAEGRVAVESLPYQHMNTGAAPITASGRLAVMPANTDRISSGVPYTVDGELSADGMLFFEFNGTTMYATMPAWTPLGLPYKVGASFLPLTVDSTERRVTSGTIAGVYLSATNTVDFKFLDTALAAQTITGPTAVAGTKYEALAKCTATGVVFTVNGIDYTSASIPASNTQNPLSAIAALPTPANYLHGPIWSQALPDNSPLTGRSVNEGNAALYGTLDQAIVLEDDLEIEWDMVYDNTGSGAQAILAQNAAGYNNRLEMNETGNPAPDQMSFRAGGAVVVFTTFSEDLATGQHFTGKLVRTSGVLEAFVDGVSKGTQAHTATFTIDQIGKVFDANTFNTNSALGNIRIKDTTNNLEWFYGLGEGTGTTSTDALGSGNDVTWTAANWLAIPDNSRRLPMNEGAGNKFLCYDGNGIATPANDATIAGYVDDTPWKAL